MVRPHKGMTVYENWNIEEFFKRFKITCLKCGSDDVKISGDRDRWTEGARLTAALRLTT